MSSSIIQPSFTGGELSPALAGRVDLARYQTSARTMRNFIAQLYGGVTNRPGFAFINKTKLGRARLLPFQFSTVQTYVIEAGSGYFRFYKDGGIIESAPGVPVEIATPYLSAQLFDLKFTQSADVMTITHPAHQPRQLARSSHVDWTLTPYVNQNGPFQDVNVDPARTVLASDVSGSITLTASVAMFDAAQIGSLFYLEDGHAEDVKPWSAGQPNLPVLERRRSDGKVYEVTRVPGEYGVYDPETDTYGTTGLGSSGYRTGGNRPLHDEGMAWDGDGSIESTNTFAEGVEWRYLHSGFGLVRIDAVTDATHATATVLKRLPDSVTTYNTFKFAFSAWGAGQGWPSCVTYHQERQVFGATPAQPQAYWMTRTGAYNDFSTSVPTQDDDAISKSIPGRQVNSIRHFLPVDELMFMTSGAEFKMLTGDNGAVTPGASQAKPQSYNGSSHLPPIVAGSVALYLQEKGSIVRDIGYDYQSDKYVGQDLTVLASHLFSGRQIVDWAYAQVPMSCVWAVRDDGVLLGLTYMREQQVMGWHRHDTDGYFESVCAISEGREDALYAVVRRVINGTTVRYVERLRARTFASVEDAFFVDSGLSYDGRNQAGTLTITGGEIYDEREQVTATIAGATLVLGASNVGDAFVFTAASTGADGTPSVIKYRLTIEEVVNATTAKVRANRRVPIGYREGDEAWDFAVRDVGGLSHLEGKTVSILADGNVHPQQVVVGGVVSLQAPASVIHAGLPIEADFETLDLSMPSAGETVRDKKKIVSAVRLLVQDTRGLLVGTSPNALYEIKEREFENYDDPTHPATGLVEARVSDTWNKTGRVFMRQSDPLPATILAVIPEVSAGGA